MDRITPGPAPHCASGARSPIRVAALEAGGDWINAQDVARAMARLPRAPKRRHDVYNSAYGQFAIVRELIGIVREVLPKT